MPHTTISYTDSELEMFWRDLGNMPFEFRKGDDKLSLSENWYIFNKGTHREDIWQWFDQLHTKGVHYLLYK